MERRTGKGEMNMGFKRTIVGLGAALALAVTAVSPAGAVTGTGIVTVSVTVSNNGAGVINFSISNGATTSFAAVLADAKGDATTGLVPAGNTTFDISVTGDDKLDRPGGAINIKLGDGSNAIAYLAFGGTVPSYVDPSRVSLQIPGRYLSISGMNNPQQLKYTGGPTSTSGAVWSGTTNGVGRVPRVAGSATVGKAIYKVGDIGGTFNSPATGPNACHVTVDNTIVAWPTACGNSAFAESNVTKQIDYIYDGSGFVAATHTIQLGLNVPAGIYPGTYTGVLTLESTIGE